MLLFPSTWQKFDGEPIGFRQFHYLFEKDVSLEWGRATYPNLNEGRKKAVRFYWFTAELNNGGLPQYFWNSSGAFTADQIADFSELGCTEAARVLVSASLKVFGNDHPPIATLERRICIENYFGTRPFNDDDDRERLLTLDGKDELRMETNQLADLQKEITVTLCFWFRRNTHYFKHLR